MALPLRSAELRYNATPWTFVCSRTQIAHKAPGNQYGVADSIDFCGARRVACAVLVAVAPPTLCLRPLARSRLWQRLLITAFKFGGYVCCGAQRAQVSFTFV
jgi:hypothetical protein